MLHGRVVRVRRQSTPHTLVTAPRYIICSVFFLHQSNTHCGGMSRTDHRRRHACCSPGPSTRANLPTSCALHPFLCVAACCCCCCRRRRRDCIDGTRTRLVLKLAMHQHHHRHSLQSTWILTFHRHCCCCGCCCGCCCCCCCCCCYHFG